MSLHPITAASFAIVDREVGPHSWSAQEYAIVRRAIHSTADFDLNQLFRFSKGAITSGVNALQARAPVVVDVGMVAAGVRGAVERCQCQLHCAIAASPEIAPENMTRTEAGMRAVAIAHPRGIFVVGNAPTALLALVELVEARAISPALIVGVPVGFVAVEQAKQALADVDVPQIVVQGRKGGSPVAAAIVNALVALALTSE